MNKFFYRHLCFRRQSKLIIRCVSILLITIFFNLLQVTSVWAQIDGDGICEDVDVSLNNQENDVDGDGICEDVDVCPYNPENDTDGDGICEDVDAQTKRSAVDSTHEVISRRIELSASWLDKFFDD